MIIADGNEQAERQWRSSGNEHHKAGESVVRFDKHVGHVGKIDIRWARHDLGVGVPVTDVVQSGLEQALNLPTF